MQLDPFDYLADPIPSWIALTARPDEKKLENVFIFMVVSQRLYKAKNFRKEWWVGQVLHEMTRHVNELFFQLFAPGQKILTYPRPRVYAVNSHVTHWQRAELGPSRLWYLPTEEKTEKFIQLQAWVPESAFLFSEFNIETERQFFDD